MTTVPGAQTWMLVRPPPWTPSTCDDVKDQAPPLSRGDASSERIQDPMQYAVEAKVCGLYCWSISVLRMRILKPTGDRIPRLSEDGDPSSRGVWISPSHATRVQITRGRRIHKRGERDP
jgi:hypothetical protein